MRIIETEQLKRIIIDSGEYYVSNRNVIISTVLGSCVSACLYDPIKGVIGMNHFLLSHSRYARQMPICVTEAGRYGIHAMELLINGMMKLGAKRENLRAKAFGGGAVFETSSGSDNFFCVGDVNIRFIREFLKNENIPLVSSDLGGNRGRVIYFCFDDFSVYVRKVKRIVYPKLLQREKQFWQKNIEDHQKKAAEPDIWG